MSNSGWSSPLANVVQNYRAILKDLKRIINCGQNENTVPCQRHTLGCINSGIVFELVKNSWVCHVELGINSRDLVYGWRPSDWNKWGMTRTSYRHGPLPRDGGPVSCYWRLWTASPKAWRHFHRILIFKSIVGLLPNYNVNFGTANIKFQWNIV